MVIRKKKYIFLGLAVFFISSLSAFLFYPLALNEMTIRNLILRETPIGTSRNNVESYLGRKGFEFTSWKYEGDKNKNTLTIGSMAKDFGFAISDANDKRIAYGGFRAHLGSYWLLLRTDVDGFWLFDSNDKLLDVFIGKTVDGP